MGERLRAAHQERPRRRSTQGCAEREQRRPGDGNKRVAGWRKTNCNAAKGKQAELLPGQAGIRRATERTGSGMLRRRETLEGSEQVESRSAFRHRLLFCGMGFTISYKRWLWMEGRGEFGLTGEGQQPGFIR